MSGPFFDSNVLLYTISRNDPRRQRSADLLMGGGTISVQCLNEFVSVALRKFRMSWEAVVEARDQLMPFCDRVLPLTVELHERGIALARRYTLSVYDGMIVAAALDGNCDVLWSEDMHDGLVVEGRLKIANPFRA